MNENVFVNLRALAQLLQIFSEDIYYTFQDQDCTAIGINEITSGR